MLVHDRPCFHRNDGFWCRWSVAQSTMRSFSVVVFSPFFDQDLCLFQRVEDLAVQKFISKPCIEAFAVAVFPRASWLNVGGLSADRCNPITDGLSNELWAIVWPNEGRNAAQDKQVRQRIDD